MVTGRNDPCPCGSGKKFKKCCMDKASKPPVVPTPPAPRKLDTATHWQPPPRLSPPPPPPPPRELTPEEQRQDALWEEFEAQDAAGHTAVFLRALDDPELMTGQIVFDLLEVLHADAVKAGDRSRFAEAVAALRERRPEAYAAEAALCLSWLVGDALADGRPDDARAPALEMAALGGDAIDLFSRSVEALAYHGQQSVIVEALRIAWPTVKSSTEVLPWAIDDFATRGANHEIFDHVEHAASADAADPALLERVRYFVDDIRQEYLVRFVDDLTGRTARAWAAEDFKLAPPRKKRRDDWDEDDEDEDRPPPDPGAANLGRLLTEFVGYLRREEGVPFARGDLARQELYTYFLQRHEGDLNPRPGMLEAAMHPKKKLPPPPKPGHPLCPERVTLDVHLSRLMGGFNFLHHVAAALFELIPAWLRFLEARGLIDAGRREKTVEELRPMQAQLVKVWETFTDDPALYRHAQAWPADAARGPAEVREAKAGLPTPQGDEAQGA